MLSKKMFIIISIVGVLFVGAILVRSAPVEDNFQVDFTISHESPWGVCIDDSITNLQDSGDDFPYKAVLNETNVNLSKVSVQFFEWKSYDVADTEIVCTPYTIDANDTTYEMENCTRIPAGTHKEWRWVERRLTDHTEDGSELRNQWDEVHIKKGETKQFRRCYNFGERTYGSYGYTYLDVKGVQFYDFSESSWWDTATYGYAYEIHSNATEVMPIPVNDTFGVKTDIFWTVNTSATEIKWLVSTGSDATGTVAIGNETDETPWENETEGGGYNPTDVWDSNYAIVTHMNNITVIDSTSNGHVFTKEGDPQNIAGVFGGGIDFDGTGDDYDFPVLGVFDGDYTIEFWMLPTAHGRQSPLNLDGEKNSFVQFDYAESIDERVDFIWYEGAVAQHSLVSTQLPLNEWAYIVVVVNNTQQEIRMYVNGSLDATDLSFGGMDPNNLQSTIGSYDTGSLEFDGRMDEFRVSNIARNESYINATWKAYLDVLTTLGAEETPNFPPLWFNNDTSITSPATYDSATNYGFQVNWTDDNDANGYNYSFFEHNFTGIMANYSTIRSENISYYNFTSIPAGDYMFRFYTNDSADVWNVTDQWNFTVNKAATTSNLLLDGIDGNRTYVQDARANFTCDYNVTYPSSHCWMASNYTGFASVFGTNPFSNYTTLATLGTGWNMTGYFEGNQNYTSSFETHYFNVTEAPIIPRSSISIGLLEERRTGWFGWLYNTYEDILRFGFVIGDMLMGGFSIADVKDINATGNISGNIIYGEMWNYTSNVSAWVFELDDVDVYHNLTNLTAGELNGFTFISASQVDGGSYLTADVDGLYKMDFSISFEAQGKGLYGISVSHNWNVSKHRDCYARRSVGSAGDVGNVGITCLMDIEQGNNITIQIEDEMLPIKDIEVHTANLNIIRVGD